MCLFTQVYMNIMLMCSGMYIIFVCVYASYIKYVCVFMLMHMYGCVDVFSICMCRGYGKGKKVSYYMCLCEKR